jgi:site-specific DNA-cytosine methylase
MSVTVSDLFCGAGGSSLGAEMAGAELRLGLNHWKLAIETHAANFQHADHDCEDVSSLTTAQIRRYPDSDILLASPECFPAGTLILTERGQVPIEEVAVGDLVLTHKGNWRSVVRTQSKTSDTVIVRGQGYTPGIEVTPNHRFWLRRSRLRWDNALRQYRREFDEPEFIPVSEAAEYEVYWGTPSAYGRWREPQLQVPDVPSAFGRDARAAWWAIGRWLADGSLTEGSGRCEVSICCGFHEQADLAEALDRTGTSWKWRALRTAALFYVHDQDANDWLRAHFGHGAAEKHLPGWAITMNQYDREQLLAGYVSGDGHVGARRARADTVSRRLALDVRLLAESLGYRAGLYLYDQHTDVIEGRKVTTRPIWAVAWETNRSQRETFQAPMDEQAWSRIRAVEPGREAVEVFNLEVADDHSYVAEGIVVANCTNHSLAKGAMRRKPQAASLFSDGPAGDAEQDRSRATMWDVVRFAEQKLLKGKPYKAIVVENVVDAFRWGYDDDGGLFDAWLLAMRALGYEHEIVWLNSMFAGAVPQSRDRMYVVFWNKKMRRPNLKVEPIAWCSACRKLVEGRQTWKKPGDRVWGRYGHQYIYGCPDCHGVVHPGAHPAAAAIDWTLAGTVIGERKHPLADSTIERIRRGLTRLGETPFALRIMHAGSPTPPTLPLMTLTRRQDIAMVFPTGGCTYETTPGNRAKASDRDPLQAIHGSLERALLVPPNTGSDARPAALLPWPAQTTTTRAALVEMQNHGGCRELIEPVHCFRAGGFHHAVVMANRIHGEHAARDAETGPTQTMTTAHGGGVAVVLASYGAAGGPAHKQGWARAAGDQPFGGITVKDSHSLVMAYAKGNHPRSAELEPTSTLTTRDRLALIVPDGEAPAPLPKQEWTDADIDQCRFRMFELHEIARAMSMHAHKDGVSDYVVIGNKRERMAQYGNAVTPPAMELLVGRLLEVM